VGPSGRGPGGGGEGEGRYVGGAGVARGDGRGAAPARSGRVKPWRSSKYGGPPVRRVAELEMAGVQLAW